MPQIERPAETHAAISDFLRAAAVVDDDAPARPAKPSSHDAGDAVVQRPRERSTMAPIPVERLRGLDAAFLYLETPSQHMHVTATMILEPGPGTDQERTADEVTETFLRRLSEQDAFRKRIIEAPLGIAHPAWVDVARLHPQEHVRSRMLPGPGTHRPAREIVGEIAGVGLDRSRPLWELWTITGIEGGRIGVVLKVHHAMLDGVAGLGVLGQLFTTEPETGPAHPTSTITEEPAEPSALRLWRGGFGRRYARTRQRRPDVDSHGSCRGAVRAHAITRRPRP